MGDYSEDGEDQPRYLGILRYLLRNRNRNRNRGVALKKVSWYRYASVFGHV